MSKLFIPLLVLLANISRAQTFEVGVDAGFYGLKTDKVGIADPNSAGGVSFGVNTGYYLSDVTAIYSGISVTTSNAWDKSRFYRIPITFALSMSKRGMLRANEVPSIANLLSLGFIPQSLELEGGLTMGFYNGNYTQDSKVSATIINSNGSSSALSYELQQQNTLIVPSIDLGFRYTWLFGRVYFYVRPRYSVLLARDNKVLIKNLQTGEIATGSTNSSFSITAGLAVGLN
jgi:hypothetical protein